MLLLALLVSELTRCRALIACLACLACQYLTPSLASWAAAEAAWHARLLRVPIEMSTALAGYTTCGLVRPCHASSSMVALFALQVGAFVLPCGEQQAALHITSSQQPQLCSQPA